MSFFQWPNIDLHAGNIIEATISDVDHTNLKASCYELTGMIPIHYHCTETDVEDDGGDFDSKYPDEQDERGASAFTIGDRVLVLYRETGNKSPIIIGFAEEDKACCNFKFQLTGEEEGLLTEGVGFSVFDEEQTSQPITDLQYDGENDRWVFSLDTEQEGVTCEGPFWVRYVKAGFKTTQYQGIDDSENFFQEGNRVVMGDGTLYYDTLALLEGEIEYWEDWEDDLLCGHRNWILYLWIDSAIPEINAECPSLPISGEGEEGATGNVDISNQIFSISLYSNETQNTTCLANCTLDFETEDEEEMIPSWKRLILKISDIWINENLTAWSYTVFSITFKTEDDKRSAIFFYPSTIEPREISSYKSVYVSPDIISTDDPTILDLKELFGSFLDVSQKIKGIYFFFMSSQSDRMDLSLDYIHFQKWEDWIDWNDKENGSPSLCVNNNWTIMQVENTEVCPDLPVTLVDRGRGTTNLTMADNVVSVSHVIGAENSSNYYFYWDAGDDEDKMITGITKAVLKIEASISGSGSDESSGEPCWTFEIRFQSSAEATLVVGRIGETIPWWADAYIGDNEGEEMEIDLTEYGFSSEDKIDSVYFSFNFDTWDHPTCNGNLNIYYIDFK